MQRLFIALFALVVALCLSIPVAGDIVTLEILGGNEQASPVSTELPIPLSVRLITGNTPLSNETIIWESHISLHDGANIGFLAGNKTVTDVNGVANITASLGFTPGVANITARSQTYPSAAALFTVTIESQFNTWGWIYISIVLIGSVVMLLSCILLLVWILLQNSGTEKMKMISNPIKEGAEGFFKVQYLAITALAVPTFVIVFLLYIFRESSPSDPKISHFLIALITSLSFVIGAFLSGIAGLTGMWVAVRANVRVAAAARKSYNGPIAIALRSGAFSGFLVVALSVLGVCSLYAILYLVLPLHVAQAQQISLLLVGYGFGASFVALFAQLGGGIYTKAADVGADIIGKVESNIPEDDVRNPAVVADLVGDNVGDCAGRGADLFESIAAENIGAMILAGTLAANASPQIENPIAYIVFPLMIHIFGLISSWIGMLCVRVREPTRSVLPAVQAHSSEDTEDHEPLIRDDTETGSTSINSGTIKGSDLADPMKALNIGYTITVIIATGFFLAVTFFLLYSSRYPNAWWHFAICGVLGIVVSWVFVFITIYYTDFNWWPVRNIAQASTTGAGTNVISGIAVGMESTAAPVLTIAIAIISAYWIGRTSGIEDAYGVPIGGLFGTAVATMGMLASAGFILAMDCFGPITDNAGGIAEMSQMPHDVRVITDRLDAVGNTTKALTKGYAIGSASLAAFLLFSAFLDEISAYANTDLHVVDLAIPEVWVGGLLGAMLVYLFCSLAIRAVGKSAETVIKEVRRQFRERPGIMTFEQKPDYARCVAMVSRSALVQMILPGLLTVLSPVVVGVFFRLFGWVTGRPNLGAQVGAGFLMIATIAGILAALFLNNAGGAWDNAKKYIEMGVHGGKGSDTHKAAVTGDTVGDPFKDTAGPSVHVLIKLLSTISLVLAPILVGTVHK